MFEVIAIDNDLDFDDDRRWFLLYLCVDNETILFDLEQINVADRQFGPGTPMGKTVFGCLVAT